MNRKQRRAKHSQDRRQKTAQPLALKRASATARSVIVAPDSRLGSFLWQQERRLHLNLSFGHVSVLAPLVQAAYDAAFDALPKPLDQMLWHLFALCHRSFLTAIGTIARGQPDEAGAVSRRALEMAKLAIALKHDPANAKAWAAYDERLARWKQRDEGVKPSPLRPKLTYPE